MGATKSEQGLLLPKEAADFLGVKLGTLSVWRCLGRYKLPFVRVGRSVRYRKEDLQQFVLARREAFGVDLGGE